VQPGIIKAGKQVIARAEPVIATAGRRSPHVEAIGFPASPTYTPSMAPAAHPLGPPTVSDTLITVDLLLQQPTRITQMIMDLTQQRFIADMIFSSGGGVTGGAVVYDQATMNQLYTERDVEKVAPGGEFPLVTSAKLRPRVAEVEKYGGKVFITDEARDRNQQSVFANQIRQLANTMVRKINLIAVTVLVASVDEYTQTFGGHPWSAVQTAGSTASQASEYPAADFAKAQQYADQQELGVTYDLWLLNPQEMATLITLYGSANLSALLSSMGLNVYSSNRVPAGKAYVVASGQVGEMRVEKPLGTETWREPEEEKTFVQSSVRPVMYVTNPFSVLEVTGIA
jgi:hypothetical protein